MFGFTVMESVLILSLNKNMLMYLYCIIILLSSSFGAVTNNKCNEKNSSCEDGPVNIQITKELLDIRIGGKKWNNNLNELVESNIRDALTSNSENKPIPEIDCQNETTEKPDVITDAPAVTDPRIIQQLDSITSQLQNICQKSECVSASTVVNVNGNNTDTCNNIVGLDKPPFCDVSVENTGTNRNVPKNCKEVQNRGQNVTGIYEIQPNSTLRPIWVLCDMETRGGGWTVVQKRFDGSEDFDRTWRDYKFGFGNLKREHWIGLENMYQITAFQPSELLVEITDRDKISAYANYKGFAIGSETLGYVLNVLNGYSGDAGDSLTELHLNSKFTTKDLDQDTHPQNCAVLFTSGWWFRGCLISNLNGKYMNLQPPVQFTGLHWRDFRGQPYSHAGSRMLVRPAQL